MKKIFLTIFISFLIVGCGNSIISSLPEPPGTIESSEEEKNEVDVEVSDVSMEDYLDYVQKCKNEGFTEIIEDDDEEFIAINKDGLTIEVYYFDDDKSIEILLTKE